MARFGADRQRSRELAAFCAVAGALLAYLFRDGLLHGYVLGQADILFDFLPWRTYAPLGLRVHNRMLGDIPTVFYPFLQHARESIRDGGFPLWSSAIASGQPFFASFQSAVLSPFTLLDYALPFPASFTADVAARLFVGGVGMYLFLRSLPLGQGAATFGGIAFLLNPFSIVWLEHPLSATAAWLPWLLWGVDRVVQRPGARAAGLLAVVTALALLSGHPETTFKIVLLVAAYAAYRGIATRAIVKTLAVAGAAMVLGAIVASVQILPFLEYARESRVLAFRRAVGALLTSPLSAFVTTFVPDFYGTPLRDRFVLQATNYAEQQLYPGIVTWLFAIFALAHARQRGRAIFFLAAGAFAVLIMYGTAVTRAITLLIPPLRVAALSRFGLLGIVGVIVAGAIGVDAVLGRAGADPPDRSMRAAAAAAAMALVVAAIVAAFLWAQHDLLAAGRQWRLTLDAVSTSAVWLAGGVALVFARRWLERRTVMALAIVLLSADLLAFADGFHAATPRAQVFPTVPELAIPQADRGLFRVAGWGHTLIANTSMVYGLQDFRGYDGIGIRDYANLLDVGFYFNGSTHELVNVATAPLIDLLNIKYVLTAANEDLPRDRFDLVLDGPTRLYVNRNAQPRAFLVDRYVVLAGDEARRAIRAGLDLRRVAVVERPLDPALRPDAAGPDPGSAEIVRYADHAVAIRTIAAGRRLLVLSDVHYPGWVATVDGRPAAIHKTNYAFRGVSVPAGEHTVEFRYRPASVRYGAYASIAGLLVVLGLLIRGSTAAAPRDAFPGG